MRGMLLRFGHCLFEGPLARLASSCSLGFQNAVRCRSRAEDVASMVKNELFEVLNLGVTLTLRKIIETECRQYPS